MATKIDKITSTTTTDENTGVRTTKYSNGKLVIDTPNKTKGGFDRVVSGSPNKDENKSSWIPPRLTLAGGAVEPKATVTIPKGTPIASISSVIDAQLAQYKAAFPDAVVTTAHGSIKVF